MFSRYKSNRQSKSHSGFTLLELLVVIALLALVAGAVLVGYGGVQDQGRADVTRFEMAEIRKALLQFRRDSGSHDFPGQGVYDCTTLSIDAVSFDTANGLADNWPASAPSAQADQTEWEVWCASPANFWMLFANPKDDPNTNIVEEGGWDPDTKRGWNGPYLQRKSGYLDIGDDLTPNASGSPITGTPIENVWGIADPNIKEFVTETDGDVHLAWRASTSQADPHSKYGRPYLLFGMDTDAPDETDDDRLVSMSANGDYDGIGSEVCLPPLDPDTSEALDTVLCLLR